ncbi:MAG TPA: hypothetical protein VHP33_14315 [Polyangiaceae bacterium]|nr:hypothetical protein [Polyangiaceae bacterium]
MSQADEEESLLPPEEAAAWLTALEAALRPSELDPAVGERLLEMALEDPLAPPSEEELIESARLRDALDQGTPDADAALLRALGAPFAAPAAPPSEGAAVERALQAALEPQPQEAQQAEPAGPARRSNVVYAVFGAGSALLAAAAAAVLFVGTMRSSAPAPARAAAYAEPRSTASLFTDRFETGDTTARMDLIASARSRDLRDNRYAAWGVR